LAWGSGGSRRVSHIWYIGSTPLAVVDPAGLSELDDALSWKEERTLSQALTLQYDKVTFILELSEQAKAAIGKRVTVVDYPDGRLWIRYCGVELAYRTLR
jgi:hypothetical protein